MVRNKGARLASLAAVGVLAFGALAACGSSDSDGGSATGGTDSSSGGASGKVGVILPDSKSSVRWETQDRPNLEAAFKAAGLESIIQNAEGSPDAFGQLCDQMITEGVDVLIETDLDPDSGKACIDKAKNAGIAVIDYDRLTLGGGADYYVSFDNVKVGELQGQGLIDGLQAAGTKSGNIAFINGAATDNNATLFKQGYEQVIKDDGSYTVVGDQTGDWDPDTAGKVFDQFYAAHPDLVGLITANDGMAGGVIAREKAAGVEGTIPVTGQDATAEGLANVLQGYQFGTVFKDTSLEAKAASDLAIAIINGDDPSSIATGSVSDTELGVDVPSVLATPVWITADTVKDVVAAGQADAADICKGIEDLCSKYGVS
ncbi:periplasmic binding protein/LacI transcriptional regulator [Nocardioides sp. PD653]|nr:periplasmic binding protein/LacI transcriptional regulator [Nocardioides sp. PD653-B2]GAW55048.1 periplasmic binding protein/LacI transcriptional regulator [Nocardioides sp. PD653]